MTDSDATQPATARPADPLDVVVLGGGGHVGLPLSLAFAEAGLRVGIFDINGATLDRIGGGRDAVPGERRRRAPRSILETGRLELSADAAMIGRADTIVLVIGTPVDEFLGPSMRVFERAVDQIAPHVRDGALVVLRSTVYPGTTEYVTAAFEDRGLQRGRRVLPGADRGGPRARGAPQPAPDRRRGRASAPAIGRRPSSRRLAAKTIRTTSKEAELAKLFTNTWRYTKFAVANQFFAIADQAGVDYTNVLRRRPRGLPARRGPARSRLRGRPVPVQGHDAAGGVHRRTTSRLGQAAMQINEGMPAYIVSALERRHGTLRGKTVGILGMAFKAESDDIRASLSFKLRKLLEWSGARRSCAPTRTSGRPAGAARGGARAERHPRHRRAAPRVSVAGPRRAARSSTSGTPPATGSGSRR